MLADVWVCQTCGYDENKEFNHSCDACLLPRRKRKRLNSLEMLQNSEFLDFPASQSPTTSTNLQAAQPVTSIDPSHSYNEDHGSNDPASVSNKNGKLQHENSSSCEDENSNSTVFDHAQKDSRGLGKTPLQPATPNVPAGEIRRNPETPCITPHTRRRKKRCRKAFFSDISALSQLFFDECSNKPHDKAIPKTDPECVFSRNQRHVC